MLLISLPNDKVVSGFQLFESMGINLHTLFASTAAQGCLARSERKGWSYPNLVGMDWIVVLFMAELSQKSQWVTRPISVVYRSLT
jgi:hypothetical protein